LNSYPFTDPRHVNAGKSALEQSGGWEFEEAGLPILPTENWALPYRTIPPMVGEPQSPGGARTRCRRGSKCSRIARVGSGGRRSCGRRYAEELEREIIASGYGICSLMRGYIWPIPGFLCTDVGRRMERNGAMGEAQFEDSEWGEGEE